MKFSPTRKIFCIEKLHIKESLYKKKNHVWRKHASYFLLRFINSWFPSKNLNFFSIFRFFPPPNYIYRKMDDCAIMTQDTHNRIRLK